ncbi:MAG: hypothetical protein ACHQ53_06345 [Polyangiales bacterium]
MDEYDIYIRGFAPGWPERPELGLQRVFGLHPDRGRELIASLPRVVKRHVPATEIERYERALRDIGADLELRRSPIRPQQIMVVRGSVEAEEAARREQHGSTLTLPPPPPSPPVAENIAPPPARMGTIVGSARVPLPSDTLVDPRPPIEHADDVVLDPPRGPSGPTLPETRVSTPAGPTLPEAPAPRVSQEHAHARPLPLERLASAAPVLDWRPPPELGPAARAEPSAPEPARSRAVEQVVDARPPPPPAWAGIEPTSTSMDQGDLPPPSAVPGLQGESRPGWMVDGADKYQVDSLRAATPRAAADDAAGSVPDLGPVVSAQSPGAIPAPRPVRAVGLGAASDAADAGADLSGLLRWMMRAGMGFAFFMILGMLRHCRTFDTEVDKALSSWGEPSASESHTASEPAGPATLDPKAPVASEWMESDLHQFSNGDKDRVRDLVRRFMRAGAVEVRVGHISRSGMVEIGSELIVLLPHDPGDRKAVLTEYDRFLQSTFGGLAATPKDTGASVLRVAL